MSAVVRRRAAQRDLGDIFYHYARDATVATARRFLKQAEATFATLAAQPGLGTRYDSDEPTLAELRYFPVARFKAYIVFYRPIPGGLRSSASSTGPATCRPPSGKDRRSGARPPGHPARA